MKHHDQRQLGEERVHLASMSRPSSGEAKVETQAGTWRRELNTGHGGMLHPGLFFLTFLVCLLIPSGPFGQGGAIHSELDTFMPMSHETSAPQACLRASLRGTLLQLRLSFLR